MAATKLSDAVVDKQLKERTDLTYNKIGPEQRDSILPAGIALQKAGVIKADVDVKKAVDDLIDDRYVRRRTEPRWLGRHAPPHCRAARATMSPVRLDVIARRAMSLVP